MAKYAKSEARRWVRNNFRGYKCGHSRPRLAPAKSGRRITD
jgi:hypothetical protein